MWEWNRVLLVSRAVAGRGFPVLTRIVRQLSGADKQSGRRLWYSGSSSGEEDSWGEEEPLVPLTPSIPHTASPSPTCPLRFLTLLFSWL